MLGCLLAKGGFTCHVWPFYNMPLITICQPQIVLNSLLVNFSTLSARKTARSAFPSVLLRLLSVFLAVDDQLQPSDKGRDRIEKYLPSNYFVRSNQMLSPITIYGTSSVLVIIGRKNMPFPPSYSVSMFSLQPFYSVQFAVQALPATCRAWDDNTWYFCRSSCTPPCVYSILQFRPKVNGFIR